MALGTRFCLKFCFVHYYRAAREGNAQSRVIFQLCRKKTKWWTDLPGGFACPIPLSMRPIFARSGRVISGRLANSFEEDLKRKQNYCVQLLALYLRRMIIKIQYSVEVVSQRGSCRNNAFAQSPREKL